MTAPMLAWNTPRMANLAAVKTQRALLIDQSETRDLRAEIMRKVGIEVDSAADITEARSMWRPDLYTLVLINVADNLGDRERFCQRLRTAIPAQQFMFLVGAPDYLSVNPGETGEALASATVMASVKLHSSEPGSLQQRWGILEASRRISQVRSAHLARSRASQVRAQRQENARVVQPPMKSLTLDDLVRKEMQ